MREVLIFAGAASILGTVFFVSLFELIFTIHRRKMNQSLQAKIAELRGTYNQSVNELVIKDDAEIIETEEQLKTATETSEEQKKQLETEYTQKIEEITASSQKALAAAKAKAKKLQEEAREKADQYLSERKKEVEEELMNLVISVTKKVLPEGISYEGHKELVMQALRDINAEKS